MTNTAKSQKEQTLIAGPTLKKLNPITFNTTHKRREANQNQLDRSGVRNQSKLKKSHRTPSPPRES